MEELRNGQVHGTLEEHARWLKGKGEEVWDEGTLEEHARWLRQEFAKEKKMREDEKRWDGVSRRMSYLYLTVFRQHGYLERVRGSCVRSRLVA